MDKQQEAAVAAAGTASEDSISMKTEYPTHEVYVSEPPPVSCIDDNMTLCIILYYYYNKIIIYNIHL